MSKGVNKGISALFDQFDPITQINLISYSERAQAKKAPHLRCLKWDHKDFEPDQTPLVFALVV